MFIWYSVFKEIKTQKDKRDMKNAVSRMTIDLSKNDHKKIKQLAVTLDKSMKDFVIEAIQQHFQRYTNLIKDQDINKAH